VLDSLSLGDQAGLYNCPAPTQDDRYSFWLGEGIAFLGSELDAPLQQVTPESQLYAGVRDIDAQRINMYRLVCEAAICQPAAGDGNPSWCQIGWKG
jgi:hypothetical protein